MKEQWQEFLSNNGAVIEGNRVLHFGNPDQERRVVTSGNIMVDLSHLGLIAAYGQDSQSFLQNQFCNDVRQINPGISHLSGHCSAKGRLLSVFRLVQRGETYYMELPHDILEDSLKKLRMFVLRSQVTLEDNSDALVRIGFTGPKADQLLREAVGGDVPQQANAVIQLNDLTLIRIGSTVPRFEIWGELEPLQQLWTRLDVHGAPAGADIWEWLDIQAGIPVVSKSTIDAFVPQMLNLESLDGVSFSKGCYPGQEVVARMRYLGKLKRRMYLAHVDCDTPPQAGDNLFASGAESGQGAGKIVRLQPAPDGGYDLLAVIVIASAEQEPIHLHDQNGPVLKINPLPYTFESYGNVSGG